jgi:uncharacterized protein (TIGR03000 family)
LVFGPYRWYGGYGYPAYSCCYPTYTVSSCCGGTYMGDTNVPGTAPLGQPTPAIPTPAQKPVIQGPNAPTESTSPAPEAGTSVTPDNSGMLTIWVPFDAKVTINGLPTKSTGSRRQFISYDLKEGFSYKYEVKAEVVRDGKIVEDTKTVVLTAGANNSVAFGFNIAPSEGLAAQ